MSAEPPHSQPTASYEADPAQVDRVLLLYSGGLDTSVMLKWIQDSYEAEVVCLTVNLGQPGEDYAVIEEKAKALGAVECHVVDARERFAEEFLAPAIRANAVYGNGYPLFTALGRPLIAQLAVEYARRAGCDTIAHGCTGKGNDQVRIEATVATLAPELRTIAPVRSWQMGRDEEIAYAREHGIPVKGGTEVAPYSIDDNLWGRSSEGRWIEDLDHAPEDDVFQLVTRPEEAPDEAQTVTVGFEAGRPVSLDGERLGLVELLERARRDRLPPRGRDRRPHRGPDRRPQGARHLRGAGGGDRPHRPRGAGAPGRHDPPEPVQAGARPEVGLPGLRRALVGAAAHRPRRLHGRGQRAGDRGDRSASVQRQRARRDPLLAQRRLRRRAGELLGVGRPVLAARLARLHRALVAAVADGAPDPRAATGEEGDVRPDRQGRRSASGSAICAAATGARSGSGSASGRGRGRRSPSTSPPANVREG